MDMDRSIIICPHCGAKNKIPPNRLDEKAFCGKCHALITSGNQHDRPVTASDADFGDEVLNQPGAVIVDFWAPWCGPCRMVSPILERLASKYAGRIKVVKVNVDENPSTASRYAIRSIPSLLFFKDGNVVKSLMGALPQEELERHIEGILR